MDDALRRRLDACFDDDVTVQAEAVPELVALVERLDAEVDRLHSTSRFHCGLPELVTEIGEERDEARCLVAACWKALNSDENYGAMITLHDMLSEVEWLKKRDNDH